jgi:hypothetical protein
MDFVVMRGDRRQNLLCDLLIADGHRAQLLPEPEKWGRENLLPPGAFLVTAKASDALKEAALKYGFRLIEYGNIPSFAARTCADTSRCPSLGFFARSCRFVCQSNPLRDYYTTPIR